MVYQWFKKEIKNLVDFFKVKIDSMSLIHYLVALPGAEQLLYSIFKANEYCYDELIFELTTYSKIIVLSNVL